MSLSYRTKHCPYCNKVTPWEPTIGQIILLSFLSCLLFFPGLIYYFVSKKCCKQCGFKEIDAELLKDQKED